MYNCSLTGQLTQILRGIFLKLTMRFSYCIIYPEEQLSLQSNLVCTLRTC